MLNPKNPRDGGGATVVAMANLKADRKVSSHEETKEGRCDVDNRDEAKSDYGQNHYYDEEIRCAEDDDHDDNDDDDEDDDDDDNDDNDSDDCDDECEW